MAAARGGNVVYDGSETGLVDADDHVHDGLHQGGAWAGGEEVAESGGGGQTGCGGESCWGGVGAEEVFGWVDGKGDAGVVHRESELRAASKGS